MTQLLVYSDDGKTANAVDVNGNERIEIFNAAGTAFEIVNVPDAGPADGGKFPVSNAAGTVFLIDYENKGGGGGPIFAVYIGHTPGEAGQPWPP